MRGISASEVCDHKSLWKREELDSTGQTATSEKCRIGIPWG